MVPRNCKRQWQQQPALMLQLEPWVELTHDTKFERGSVVYCYQPVGGYIKTRTKEVVFDPNMSAGLFLARGPLGAL